MAEEVTPRRGENRIYRLIDRGPIFLGLPIIQGFSVAGATGMGYWPMKFLFGDAAGILWVLLGFGGWGVASFLNSQDKTYLPRLSLRLSGVVLKTSITAYVPSTQKVGVE